MKLKSNFYFLFFLVSLFLSCYNIDELGLEMFSKSVDTTEIETKEDLPLTLIDSFKWTSVIDERLLNIHKSVFTHFPLINNGKVVYNIFEQGGFVALDIDNGHLKWDNRGDFNRHPIPHPLEYNDILIYPNAGGVRSFNLNSGNVNHNFSLSFENKYLNTDFGFYNDKIYIHLDDLKNTNPVFDEWISSDINSLGNESWDHFNRIEAKANNGFKRTYYNPSFLKDKDGNDNMIYLVQESNNLFKTGELHLISYNITADSIKWINRNFAKVGGLSKAPIIEDNRIYVLGKEQLNCFDVETGLENWNVGSPIIKDKIYGYSDLILHEDKIIVMGNTEQILCLNKMNGSIIWSKTFLDKNIKDLKDGGSSAYTANIYNDKLYYINDWGYLISISVNDGSSFRRYALPDKVYLEDAKVELFEPSFKHQHMTISDDGVIFTSDGFRFLAFDVPKN